MPILETREFMDRYRDRDGMRRTEITVLYGEVIAELEPMSSS